jgi:phosphoserine phosphatase
VTVKGNANAMKYILTLISHKRHVLGPTELDAARASLPEAAAPDWLNEGQVADIAFTFDGGTKEIEKNLRGIFAGIGIDLAIQRADQRKKRLLVADMDSTIIQQECIDELADEMGLKPKISAITERAMRGEIAFEPALRERVALLKGLPLAALEKVYHERIRETPGGRLLTATMRHHGGYCALVSGGFTFFTQRVAQAVGFNMNRANELLMENDKLTGPVLTGHVAEPILGKEAKLESLRALRTELQLQPHETMAVGDGANDLAMIHEAGLGVAFHAKPVVAEAAHARIDHNDLTALLYLQGYRVSEFAKL